jgi:hypothetical protein
MNDDNVTLSRTVIQRLAGDLHLAACKLLAVKLGDYDPENPCYHDYRDDYARESLADKAVAEFLGS